MIKKVCYFNLLLLLFNSVVAQATQLDSLRLMLKTEVAKTQLVDEKMWGDALFISCGYDLNQQWSSQIALGYTHAFSERNYENKKDLTQINGKEIDVNILVKLFQLKGFDLKTGIGGVVRQWTTIQSYGEISPNSYSDRITMFDAGTEAAKVNYVDMQLILDASYQIKPSLGASVNYSFQGNYFAYYKIGFYVRF